MRPGIADRRAFTLVELIVVMTLIGLVASFAVPQVANFLFADQLKVGTRKLVGLIHRTSQLAQQHQVPYLLSYRPGERLFVAVREQDKDKQEDERSTNRLQLADSVSVRDVWSWYGTTRPLDGFAIRFSKNGYVEPTIIHLHKEGGQEMSLVLSPFLGQVRIMDGHVLPDKQTLFQ